MFVGMRVGVRVVPPTPPFPSSTTPPPYPPPLFPVVLIRTQLPVQNEEKCGLLVVVGDKEGLITTLNPPPPTPRSPPTPPSYPRSVLCWWNGVVGLFVPSLAPSSPVLSLLLPPSLTHSFSTPSLLSPLHHPPSYPRSVLVGRDVKGRGKCSLWLVCLVEVG